MEGKKKVSLSGLLFEGSRLDWVSRLLEKKNEISLDKDTNI